MERILRCVADHVMQSELARKVSQLLLVSFKTMLIIMRNLAVAGIDDYLMLAVAKPIHTGGRWTMFQGVMYA